MAEEKPKKEEVYYELMPHKKIKKIKKEIEGLKKKAEKESFTSKSFMNSVNSLTGSIDSLMELFKEATESMKLEEQAEEEVSKKIGPLLARMDDIEDQNKKIAQGIVTIADMVNELKEEIEKIKRPEMPKIKPMPRPKIFIPPQPRPMPHKPEEKLAPPPRFPPPGPMPGAMPPGPEERPMPPPPWEKPGAPPPMPPGPMPPIRPPGAKPKKKGLLGGLFKKK